MLAPQRILTGVRCPIHRLSSPANPRAPKLLSLQSYLPNPFRLVSNNTIHDSAHMDLDIARIHDFWYSRPTDEWFNPPEGFDSQCKTHFGDLVHSARQGKLDHWTSEPKGTLAILILLDQFSRNVYRGTPDAFSADPKALDIATHALAKGWDQHASTAQAMTYYLPLMHNESLLAQVACKTAIEKLILQQPHNSEDRKTLEDALASAKQHLKIIEKFGRYPSRNTVLGRQNTPEEDAWVRENPHGFGQPSQTEEQ